MITEVVEDNALIKYKNAERVVRLKGLSENFLEQERLKESILFGQPVLREGNIDYAVVGRGVDAACGGNGRYRAINRIVRRNRQSSVSLTGFHRHPGSAAINRAINARVGNQRKHSVVCGKSGRENQFVHLMRRKPTTSLPKRVTAIGGNECGIGYTRHQIKKLIRCEIR